MRVLKPSGVGQMQAGGGKVHEALIHSRLMHTAHSIPAHSTQHTCTCTQRKQEMILSAQVSVSTA